MRALALAAEGIRIAQEAGNIDLEMLGRAVQGLALVASGAVSEGMSKLDEVNAAVIAGELTDRVAIGLAGCYLIAACERVRDYDRAVQWCKRLKEFCAKWGLRPLFAVCRTQYASICLWRGTWLEAEKELYAASDELAASRPAMKSDALVRLAELRRRQGRLAEAAALVDQTPPHGAGLLERAELAFDCGDYPAAAERAEQYLRHVPTSNRTDRASGLEITRTRVDLSPGLGTCEGCTWRAIQHRRPCCDSSHCGQRPALPPATSPWGENKADAGAKMLRRRCRSIPSQRRAI